MKVLNAVEQEAFESPPRFNSVQRKQYFDIPVALRQIAASLRKPTYQLGFLLSCGYFKAAKQFFSPHDFHPRDIEYMAQRLGLSGEGFDAGDYSDRIRQRHQHLILKFYGFRAFDQKAQAFLGEEIAHPPNFSEQTAEMMGAEIRRILGEIDDHATRLLRENEAKLDAR